MKMTRLYNPLCRIRGGADTGTLVIADARPNRNSRIENKKLLP